MRLLPLLFALPLAAQTTSAPVVPSQTVKVTIPATSQSFTVPRNGGTVKISYPAQTLNVAIPQQTLAPLSVTLPAGMTFSITLTPAQAAALLAVFTKGGTDAGITLNLTVPK